MLPLTCGKSAVLPDQAERFRSLGGGGAHAQSREVFTSSLRVHGFGVPAVLPREFLPQPVVRRL